jgi:hypothetical protein
MRRWGDIGRFSFKFLATKLSVTSFLGEVETVTLQHNVNKLKTTQNTKYVHKITLFSNSPLHQNTRRSSQTRTQKRSKSRRVPEKIQKHLLSGFGD